jgi:hypothetical protein
MVRATISDGSGGVPSCYIAFVSGNHNVWLFAWNNGWQELSNLGAYSGTVSTIELDATGSGPVLLTVKVNGTQFGSTYSDSTYKFSGTYAGFNLSGSANTNVTGWTGANL